MNKKYFCNGFLLMLCNFKFEGVLFRMPDCLCRPTGPPHMKSRIKTGAPEVQLFLLLISYTVKPVLRGHLWNKENVIL
jgi:hypothetical protein